jgi:hypothetical protein
LPGYAIVNILENKIHKLSPVPKVLLAYIFSTAIIGGYLPGLFGIPISEILLVKSTYKNIRYQKLIQKFSLNQKFTNKYSNSFPDLFSKGYLLVEQKVA